MIGTGLVTGMVLIAALHALMPTHWLSFVLVAKAQNWSRDRMLRVVLLSGLGHVCSTTVVGLLAAALGKGAHRAVERMDTPLPAMILMAFGLYYLVMGWRRGGHPHCHHDHSEDPIQGDRLAVGALFLEMTLSPCETLIPVFFAAGGLPWTTLLMMAVGASALTLLVMGVLSFLAYSGMLRLRIPGLEDKERLLVGVLLMALGVFAYFYR